MSRMQFKYDKSNADERYAGQSFDARYGRWNPEIQEYEPGEGEVLLILTSFGWKPQFNHEDFGELIQISEEGAA